MTGTSAWDISSQNSTETWNQRCWDFEDIRICYFNVDWNTQSYCETSSFYRRDFVWHYLSSEKSKQIGLGNSRNLNTTDRVKRCLIKHYIMKVFWDSRYSSKNFNLDTWRKWNNKLQGLPVLLQGKNRSIHCNVNMDLRGRDGWGKICPTGRRTPISPSAIP